MIVIEKIAKRFGKVDAVIDAGFTVRDGEITTLLGANGSGKTTTLRAVAGLIKPDQGRCAIDGIEVAQDPVAARGRLGSFPDNFGLYPRMTTREHMAYYAELCGLKGAEMKAAIDRTAQLLQIGDIIDRKTEGFSSGQRMKVALARALVHSPQNLILDEPTRGLDVMSIRLLRDVLKDLRAQGRAILLTSHVMAEVSELSDRVVCMAGGRVVADDTPDALIQSTGAPNLEDAFVKLAA